MESFSFAVVGCDVRRSRAASSAERRARSTMPVVLVSPASCPIPTMRPRIRSTTAALWTSAGVATEAPVPPASSHARAAKNVETALAGSGRGFWLLCHAIAPAETARGSQKLPLMSPRTMVLTSKDRIIMVISQVYARFMLTGVDEPGVLGKTYIVARGGQRLTPSPAPQVLEKQRQEPCEQ